MDRNFFGENVAIQCGERQKGIGQDNTFSIVGFEPETGALGVAVATARLAVGNRVPFAVFGVGAIATQANTNVILGYEGLEALKSGKSAEAALTAILRRDGDRESRQISIMDAEGNGAAFTGSKADKAKGHIIGENHIVAGNMLVDTRVLAAMSAGFMASSGDLADKLMMALEAGQREGGDKRGKISSALYVVTNRDHPYIDLRIDQSEGPVRDLRILYGAYKAALL